jgi:hypothetical protein
MNLEAATKVAEFEATIQKVQEAGTTNKAALDDLTRQLAGLRAQVEMSNREQVTEDRDFGGYASATERTIAQGQAHYVKRDGTSVRLLGHTVKHEGYVGYLPGLLDDPKPANEAHADLQRAWERRSLTRRMLAASQRIAVDRVHTPTMDFELERAASRCGGIVHKIFADSSAIGAEFMREQVSPAFEREVMAPVGAMSLIEEYNHPGGTLKIPYESGYLQLFKHAIPTTNDPNNDPLSGIGTGSVSVDSVPSVVATQLDRDATEDSIGAIIPSLERNIAEAFAFFDELSLMNGCVDADLDDLDTWDPRGRIATKTEATHPLTRWDGMRNKAKDASKTANLASLQTYAGLVSIFNLLGIEQRLRADGSASVAGFINPEWWFLTGLHLDEFKKRDYVSQTSVETGGAPGNVRGALRVGTLAGLVPMYLSYGLTPDLNASGVYDDTTTTKGLFVVANLDVFQHWVRRGLSVERDVEVRNNTLTLVARKRSVVRTSRLKTGQTAAAVGYGLSAV